MPEGERRIIINEKRKKHERILRGIAAGLNASISFLSAPFSFVLLSTASRLSKTQRERTFMTPRTS